jgi:tRNA A-37 threonylcarbamoyl transferase component Bud32/tetratricopeptide (TPR) repeat protein
MNPERGQRVYTIFEAALQCDPAGRADLLNTLCGDDNELRAEVERLLADDDRASRDRFLTDPSPPGQCDQGHRPGLLGLRGLDIHILCPHCRNPIELVGPTVADVVCPACGSTFRLERESTASLGLRGNHRRLGRFELIEAVGIGAFGTVYKARDPQLDRVVAIKVPRAGRLATQEDRGRFLREARSVAQLRHAGIVPVHEVGEHEDVPFLVSDFVRGVTLADLLTARRPTPREAAGLIAEVAEALQYAHEQGIVHRDVKPSNILLDDAGRPHLMDFGLAKRDAGEVTMTLDGVVLGTPAYMSPEQARGEGHRVDRRSDIYSLGVLLYELLTGELPFRGNTRMLLHQVLHDEPRPPRSLNDRVPRDLETVCLKAMAKEPHRRYATARDLADDLRRFRDGEAIRARPVGRIEKAWRWCRRNPALARLASALILVFLILLIVSFGAVLMERDRRREAEARALAETNFNVAKQAVEDYFEEVSKDALLKQQDSVAGRRLRVVLLKMPLTYYRSFLRQRQVDPKRRRDIADAQFRVGQILREIGEEPSEAIAAFKAAIAISEDLLARAPDDREGRIQLARTYHALGAQHARVRDFSPAFAALARSRGILTQLAAEQPGDASYRVALADCNRELGIDEGEAGEYDRGLEHLKEAEALLRNLLSASPGDVGYRTNLARTMNGQGFVFYWQHHDAEALRAFQEFQSICQSLFADLGPGPKPAELLDSLATSYYNVGAILLRLDPGKVLEPFEKALEYRAELEEAHPSVYKYREKLAQSLSEIAHRHHLAGRDDDAFYAARKGIEIFEKLVAAQPEQPRYHAELGRALNILGYLYDKARDNKRALPQMERALVEEERAVAESPKSDPYKLDVIEILQNLGEQYADLGTPEPGLAFYRKAVKVRQQMLAKHPGDRYRRLALAEQIAKLAMMERHAGDSAAAERSYAAAVETLDDWPAAAGDSGVQVSRGASLMGEGLAAADQGFVARALPLLDQALKILGPLGATATKDPTARQRLTEALWETARLRRRAGQPDEAELRDAERRALWKDRSPAPLAALAMEETDRAALVGYGEIFVNDRVEAVRQLELDLAAENLRMAAALEFCDPTAFRSYPNRSLLLRRPDVVPILNHIAFPDNPF